MPPPTGRATRTASGRVAVVPEAEPAGDLSLPATFSVIIPVFQGAATVGAAVASALEQTLVPLEVIVVDDGSTDDLEDALRPFGRQFRLLSKENGGAASARNAGVSMAEGEFAAFLDCDDVWSPTYLEAVAELAALRPDLDLLSTDVFFEADGEVVGRFYDSNHFEVVDQRLAILRGCFVGWPAVRRRQLQSVGGFDESLVVAHDWDAWVRLIFGGSRAGLVREPLHRYRLHTGSLTSERSRSLRERVRVLEKASTNLSLSHAEAAVAASARQALRERAAVATIREALEATEYDRRGSTLNLVTTRSLPVGTRLLALAAAISPPLARRLLHTDTTESLR